MTKLFLDVIEKREIQFTVHGPYIEFNGDKFENTRPWVLLRIDAQHNNQKVGYLKICWVDSKRFEKCCPSIFDFFDICQGWPLRYHQNLQRLWLKTLLHANIPSPKLNKMGYHIGKEDYLNDQDTLEELEIFRKRPILYKRYENWCRKYLEFCYVDYISVEEEYRRQKIATSMYQLGAMWVWLHKRQPLYSSTLQSAHAKGAWAYMVSNGIAKQKKHVMRGKNKKDLRVQGEHNRFFINYNRKLKIIEPILKKYLPDGFLSPDERSADYVVRHKASAASLITGDPDPFLKRKSKLARVK